MNGSLFNNANLHAKSKIANEFGLSIYSDLSSWLEAIAVSYKTITHGGKSMQIPVYTPIVKTDVVPPQP